MKVTHVSILFNQLSVFRVYRYSVAVAPATDRRDGDTRRADDVFLEEKYALTRTRISESRELGGERGRDKNIYRVRHVTKIFLVSR